MTKCLKHSQVLSGEALEEPCLSCIISLAFWLPYFLITGLPLSAMLLSQKQGYDYRAKMDLTANEKIFKFDIFLLKTKVLKRDNSNRPRHSAYYAFEL